MLVTLPEAKMEMEALSFKRAMLRLMFLLTFASCVLADVNHLTESNWTDMLKGEWLVKFYAPWCPACRSLESTWEKLGSRSFELNMKFAKIDVTENAVLSGRFFIVSLPTIYHVKDGVFRQYKGQRSEIDVVNYVRDELWKEQDPVPWYLSPTTPHMAAVGTFFKFSIAIRDVHTKMTNEYGIPVWGSYIIFAVATILLGLLIGLLIVFLCDAIHLTRSRRQVTRTHSRSPPAAGKVSASGPEGDDTNNDDDDLADDTKKSDLDADESSKSAGDDAQKQTADKDIVTNKGDVAGGLAAETGVRHRDAKAASQN